MNLQDMLELIEGRLGRNWKDEYPGIKKLKGKALTSALEAIVDELNADGDE